eukprot:IDg13770t1
MSAARDAMYSGIIPREPLCAMMICAAGVVAGVVSLLHMELVGRTDPQAFANFLLFSVSSSIGTAGGSYAVFFVMVVVWSPSALLVSAVVGCCVPGFVRRPVEVFVLLSVSEASFRVAVATCWGTIHVLFLSRFLEARLCHEFVLVSDFACVRQDFWTLLGPYGASVGSTTSQRALRMLPMVLLDTHNFLTGTLLRTDSAQKLGAAVVSIGRLGLFCRRCPLIFPVGMPVCLAVGGEVSGGLPRYPATLGENLRLCFVRASSALFVFYA